MDLVPKQVTDALFQMVNATHRTLLALSGGRLGGNVAGMPVVELHTTGRRSGKARTVLLTPPIQEADRVVLVASKGGDDRHPDWYLNLQAEPDVELTVKGERRPMRARTASPAEKADLWPQIVKQAPVYQGYERRTDRDIPVVILEPR